MVETRRQKAARALGAPTRQVGATTKEDAPAAAASAPRSSSSALTAVSAPPPSHTIATIAAMCVVFLYLLPPLESVDAVATVETFATAEFPESWLGDPAVLGCVRVLFAAFMIAVSAYEVFGDPGWDQNTSYVEGSRLKKEPIRLEGFRTQVYFTMWSWNLLALSFLLSGIIPIIVSHGHLEWMESSREGKWMRRLAFLSFEVSAPTTVLVSCVVRYALWPNCLRQGADTSGFKQKTTLIQHNANVILALTEVGILGEVPVRMRDFAVAPLFGITYVFFSWWMMQRWTPSRRPHFLYFFFDTTLGKTTTIALLLLLVILIVSYVLFSGLDWMLVNMGGGVWVHAVTVVGLSSVVCKFRD